MHKQATRTRSVGNFDVRFCVLLFISAPFGTEAVIGWGPCDELRADLALLRWRLLIAHGDKCSECMYNAAQTRLLLINGRVSLQRANLQRVNLRRSNYQDILGIGSRTKGPHALPAASCQLAGRHAGPVDQWISGGRRTHGGAEARRKQREESTTGHKGNWRVPCSCLCVKHPWLPTCALHCPGHPVIRVIHPVRVHKCPWQAS